MDRFEFSGITTEKLIEGFARALDIPARKTLDAYTKKQLASLCDVQLSLFQNLVLQMYGDQCSKENQDSSNNVSQADLLRSLFNGFVVLSREDYDKLCYQAKRTSDDSNFNPHHDIYKPKGKSGAEADAEDTAEAHHDDDDEDTSGESTAKEGKEQNQDPVSDGDNTASSAAPESNGADAAPTSGNDDTGETDQTATKEDVQDSQNNTPDGRKPTQEELLGMEEQSISDALHAPDKGMRKPSGKKPGKQEGSKGFGIRLPQEAEHYDDSLAVALRCLNCPLFKNCSEAAHLSQKKNFIDIRFSAEIYPFRVMEMEDCPLEKQQQDQSDHKPDSSQSQDQEAASGNQQDAKAKEEKEKERPDQGLMYTLIRPAYLATLRSGPIVTAEVSYGPKHWKTCIVPQEVLDRFSVMDGAVFEKPKGTNQYGPKTEAQVLRDICVLMSSYGRSQETLSDSYGLSLSTGTYDKILKKNGMRLKPLIESIRKVMLVVEEVVNCDETGIDVNGANNWIHAVCSEAYTFMEVQEKRGKAGMDACGFLEYFTGVVISDCWGPYFQFNNVIHGLCDEHILRELKGLHRFFYNCEVWSKEMMDLLLEMKQRRDELEKLGYTKMPQDERDVYRSRYEEILHNALVLFPEPLRKGKRGRPKNGKARSLILRMLDKEDALLLFLDNFDVPFTNNMAERAFRIIGVKKSEVGCFRTLEGARNFVRIWSYLSTAKKHGYSYMDALEALTHGREYELIFPRGEKAAIQKAKETAATRKEAREKAESAAIACNAAEKTRHMADEVKRTAV